MARKQFPILKHRNTDDFLKTFILLITAKNNKIYNNKSYVTYCNLLYTL